MLYLILFAILLAQVASFKPSKTGYYNLHITKTDSKLSVLAINNMRYRETVFFKNLNFATKFSASRNYTFKVNNKYVFPKITYINDARIIPVECSLSTDSIINSNSSQEVCYFKYHENTNHQLNVLGNFLEYPYNTCSFQSISIDGNLRWKFHKNFIKNIKMEKGFHYLSVKINNCGKRSLCSCPSIDNGYKSTRYLFAWINNIQEDNYQSVTISVKESSNITEDIYRDIVLPFTIPYFKKAF